MPSIWKRVLPVYMCPVQSHTTSVSYLSGALWRLLCSTQRHKCFFITKIRYLSLNRVTLCSEKHAAFSVNVLKNIPITQLTWLCPKEHTVLIVFAYTEKEEHDYLLNTAVHYTLLQCLSASVPQCLSASVPQCLSASVPQCLSVSVLRHFTQISSTDVGRLS